jgi:hypothetical protein
LPLFSKQNIDLLFYLKKVENFLYSDDNDINHERILLFILVVVLIKEFMLQRQIIHYLIQLLTEREGFEPSVGFHLHRRSRSARSTTPTPFLY